MPLSSWHTGTIGLGAALTGVKAGLLFALPRDEWLVDFDDDPIMAEALSLDKRADEVYGRIIATPANTPAGVLAKLEWK